MDPERALALSYAPADRRAGLEALFALDDRLQQIVAAARDPTIGLMRLTWWADALERLDTAPPPAEPVLQALATQVLPFGVTGTALAETIDGWERLLDPDTLDIAAYAAERGGRLFAAAASVLGAADARVGAAGEGWALTYLPTSRSARAEMLAGERLGPLFAASWPRALRPLGALALLACYDLKGRTRPGDPRRVARLLAHRLTGR